MTAPVSMPLSLWPARDRELWLEAANSPDALDASRIAGWHASSKKTAVSAYGVWLQWLADQGELDNNDPAERLSPTLVKRYAKDQIARKLSLVTVADRLSRLIAVVSGICPDCDLTSARKIANRVKRIAKEQFKPKGFIVHANRMYDLGFDLLAGGRAAGAQTDAGSTLFVDGLVIAILTACPIRIGNLVELRLDHEVVCDSNRWRLLVSGRTTKTSKPEIRFAPDDLSSSIDEYVNIIRPRLVLQRQHHVGDEMAFFIGPSGLPLRDQTMRNRIKDRTEAAFGEPVLPHSFRKLAVTTLVFEKPEHAASAHMILGHDDSRASEDNYIIGQQILALEGYHKSLKKAEKHAGSSEATKPSEGAL